MSEFEGVNDCGCTSVWVNECESMRVSDLGSEWCSEWVDDLVWLSEWGKDGVYEWVIFIKWVSEAVAAWFNTLETWFDPG